MGREFIGECTPTGDDPEFENRESEMAVKYIKQACGEPPRGVDVQITLEDHELGSYPVVSVVWDDSVCEYPDDYIEKCLEAFERFDLPEEIHQRYQLLFQLQDQMQELIDRISEAREKRLLSEKPGSQDGT
jgi:hypothetical protein